MSDNIWDGFDWSNTSASTSATSAYDRYYRKYLRHGPGDNEELRRERMIAEEYEMKVIKERMASPAKAEIDLRFYAKEFMQNFKGEVPQYMRSVMGDFEKQHEQKDVEEPQTVFHFDPKGIVDKWPEKIT